MAQIQCQRGLCAGSSTDIASELGIGCSLNANALWFSSHLDSPLFSTLYWKALSLMVMNVQSMTCQFTSDICAEFWEVVDEEKRRSMAGSAPGVWTRAQTALDVIDGEY